MHDFTHAEGYCLAVNIALRSCGEVVLPAMKADMKQGARTDLGRTRPLISAQQAAEEIGESRRLTASSYFGNDFIIPGKGKKSEGCRRFSVYA